ncbi:ARM repeat-containing protein [Gautieria morchelliformis]|nr:ARM repeat-containing protein [Gautieria morchelliformis]
MPRENRKRGKKHKAGETEQAAYETVNESTYGNFHALDEPPVHSQVFNSANEAPPFGAVDPDVKAYFRTVNDQLRDWQEERPDGEVGAEVDPNEERRMFFTAALSEMKGKELQLASDPDCSPVLERMLYSMDDFVRRVFTDSLAGSWLSLITDRFASHVCQTLLTVAADTVARESRGTFPSTPRSSDKGELFTMTQLIVNVCEDILSELPTSVHDPFASHVLRALLLLLAPRQLAMNSRPHKYAPSASSKKSASWKARIGPMKAVISNEFDITDFAIAKRAELPTPGDFSKMASRILSQFLDVLDGNEVRALAVNKVSSPVLQMLLELEASLGRSDAPDSVMDRVLAGLISQTESSPSPYVSGLFVDPTASHLSESLLSRCSSPVFLRLWDCYFADHLSRLATHPVANFVVARGVERLDAERLENTISRLHGTWTKARKSSHFGVLKSLIDRAGQIGSQEGVLVETICSMFELTTSEERKQFLPCVVRLKNIAEYRDALASRTTTRQDDDDKALGVPHRSRRNAEGAQGRDPLEPLTQGSLLLQSVLRLHEPHNSIVLESLHSLLPDELLALACNATSSRILDVALESSTVPLRSRKRLVTSFIGQFHLLVDDRIGSRVADRCWEAADPYLKEKVARSLIPHEQFLTGSYFGRYFFRSLRLPLLRHKPDQWKIIQGKERTLPTTSGNAVPQAQPKTLGDVETTIDLRPLKSNKKRKRKETHDEDEIEALFSGIGAKKIKGVAPSSELDVADGKAQPDLDMSILKAIKGAPADSGRRRK